MKIRIYSIAVCAILMAIIGSCGQKGTTTTTSSSSEKVPSYISYSENGKKAITKWQKISTQNYKNPLGQNKKVTRISFVPITGRTHQLRLAAADIHGLAMPIIGDTLYGNCLPGERLMLHARYLSFIHPVTNEKMEFLYIKRNKA